MNAIQANWNKPQARPQNKGGEHYLIEKKGGEEGKGGYEQSPLEESKSSGCLWLLIGWVWWFSIGWAVAG